MKSILSGVVLIATIQTAFAADNPFRLASLFADSMIIQQKTQVPFWGWGLPGSHVMLLGSWGAKGETTVDSTGKWLTALRSPAAGGPLTVIARCGEGIVTIHDVMCGEVWLASGQSNMEMPLEGWPPQDTVADFHEIIRNSSNPMLRFFTVKRAISPIPEDSCLGTWESSSPASAPHFSATAYFFARKIQTDLKVPVGIIHASWGGTPVEAWISSGALSTVGEFDSTLEKLKGGMESLALLKAWLHRFPATDISKADPQSRWKGLALGDDSCSLVAYNDSLWRTMILPTLWERTELGNFDGVVWFRREVPIPSSWKTKNLVLELGPIDDIDITYVNGVRVGGYEGEGYWSTPRIYDVPDTVVTDSILHIAVRVIDFQGGGGIYGREDMMSVRPAVDSTVAGDRISLSGSWRYLPVAELRGGYLYRFGSAGLPFYSRPHLAVDINPSMPSILFNGMIAPVVPFAIRGTIWYQGESNVGRAKQYERLFPLLIEDWRGEFGLPSMPFYYVQIAPFAYAPGSNSQLLREAQMKALRVKNTGMAVTLDIGNVRNIHPADKIDVGERLARWALAKAYKKHTAFSGPSFVKAAKRRGYIDLTFNNTGKGLVLKEDKGGSGFVIAGADSVFRHASADVRGNHLRVYSPDVPRPIAVRYAFTDTSSATLFNKEGLPCSSFRTDDWGR
jgi:sialate O-acetylesterase